MTCHPKASSDIVSLREAPILWVKKKDGKSRLRVDFRQRNEVPMENRCPSPKADADMDQLRDGAVFGDRLEVGLFYKNEGTKTFRRLPSGLVMGTLSIW